MESDEGEKLRSLFGLRRNRLLEMDSTLPPTDPPRDANAGEKSAANGSASTSSAPAAEIAMETEEDALPAEILAASAEEILTRCRMLDNDVKVGSIPPIPHHSHPFHSIPPLASSCRPAHSVSLA